MGREDAAMSEARGLDDRTERDALRHPLAVREGHLAIAVVVHHEHGHVDRVADRLGFERG